MARSKIRKQSTSCFLPEELVFKILTYLPVVSVLRCKSVCKTWQSIILNPQFTQTHLIQSRKKQPSSVVYMVNKSIYVDTCEDSTLLYVLDFFDRPIELVCSCNGLVCVGDRVTDDIYLGNPMTRRFKKLARSSVKLYCPDVIVLGFGFDDISSEYKILRISQVPEVDDFEVDCFDDSVIWALRAEMYSANDDSWKQIHIPNTLEHLWIERSCVNPKGTRVLYFKGAHELLSFDLHTEVFRVYNYPTSISPPQYQQIKSSVLDFEGSVALIFNESTNAKPVLSLWTLNQVLGNWSWTKKFNLDDSSNTLQLTRLYLGDGQFFARGVGKYIFYDYKKKHVKKILDRAAHLVWKLNEYTETLVSLKGFEQGRTYKRRGAPCQSLAFEFYLS